MELMPIVSALRRNRVGALLLIVQIALTLAVVANALSIIQSHMANMSRPSGMDEANLFTLRNHWVGQPNDLRARIETDVTALRGIPGVIDAEATNAFPLVGGGWGWAIRLKPDQHSGGVQTTLYFQDAHGLDAMGLKLLAGRWFSASEIGERDVNGMNSGPVAVLTMPLARKLFPAVNPVGRVMYLVGDAPIQIVGIVERAQTPWVARDFAGDWAEYSTFLPLQYVNNGLAYLVRTRPGQLATVMHATPERLALITRQRVLERLASFSETRRRAYQAQKSESWLLATVISLMLAVTALGTVGLTMYWVAQRRRQIGLRRALGATRVDILRYFHTENFLIAGTGAVLGVAGGVGANLWMTVHLGTARMSVAYIATGAVIVLALSQLAVVWPAMRAALIQPSLATRGL
jgi:putative ABC transport system permease protein